MKKHFEYQQVTRNNVLKLIENLDLAQLNKIPTGFNNNLAWNLGHIVVTQQLLCYGLSKLPMEMDNEFIGKYRKDSKPEGEITQADLDFMKNKMIVLADKMEDDYGNGIFKEYKEYTTSYNATLSSVEDGIIFNNMHEAMHFGFMIALKKLV
jgi:hypothetical protein